jgi:hypothetical protein
MATAARPAGIEARRLHREVFARWRFLAVFGVLVGALLGAGFLDLSYDLGHLQARVLSGQPEGAYQAFAAELASVAAADEGELEVVTSAGSSDNVARLAESEKCEAEFGIVQDSTRWPKGLRLVGRLGRTETLLLLGKGAGRLRRLADLRGLRMGVGARGSGTAEVARSVFDRPELADLGITFTHHGFREQLDALVDGQLDLAAFVIDPDSALIAEALGERGLEIAGLDHVPALARDHADLRASVVVAGQVDALRVLPPVDTPVLELDTLVVANDCAGHAETVALLVALSRAVPRFVEHNRDRGGVLGLAEDPIAKEFFANGGPGWADRHLPLLVDLMPPSNWVTIVMVISIAFNVMGGGHRFRLWRIDAARVRAEAHLAEVLGDGLTDPEIAIMSPDASHRTPRARERLDELIVEFEHLRARCRSHSISILVPMGQEMAYRYQEDNIERSLDALRRFRSKLGAAPGASPTPD